MPKKKMDNVVTEIPVTANALTRSIIEYLTIKGCKAWRNQTGGLPVQSGANSRGRFIRFGEVGSADIFAVIPPTGKFMGVEVKVGRDKLRDTQKDWLEQIESLGGIAIVAHTIDDVINRLEQEETKEIMKGFI